jgi:alanine dehydrogenase
MDIGVPREIKDGERRVALTPDAVRELANGGHTMRVQTGAGDGAGFSDTEYANAGATIVANAAQAFDADLVIKVKEIQTDEWKHLRAGGMLFSFLHLGADPAMARELLNRRVTGIAFETVCDARGQGKGQEQGQGRLPILAPMSAIAGELAAPIAANLLLATVDDKSGGSSNSNGKGILMRDARVLVVGAGNAGLAAAHATHAMGARVCVMARSARPPSLQDEIEYVIASPKAIAQRAKESDIVIGAVNTPGQPTPKLLTRVDVAAMHAKSVLIEICIDGGGIAETSRPTSHAAPTYVEEGVIHYCVANMPAAVPRSASVAISSAVLPYALNLAKRGLMKAMRADDGFVRGVQMHGGEITHAAVATQLGLTHLDLDAVLFTC